MKFATTLAETPPVFTPVTVTLQLETPEELGQFVALMGHRWVTDCVPNFDARAVQKDICEKCSSINQPVLSTHYHDHITQELSSRLSR